MSNHKLLGIRINTSNMVAMLELFRALGVEFKQKKVSLAGSLMQGKMGDLEILVSDSLSEKRAGQPLMSLRLQVTGLQEIWQRVQNIAGLETIMDIQDLPDGKTAVVIDPDGRAIELCEPWPET